jgi:hypothetical protein|tara:strand:- start:2841 stop:3266 length:426 start_codon:yes stop_codon:yes gene_type:complete
MKTFKQHIKEDGKMVGTATSNAVEDGSVGAHNIHKPEILNKVNAFVGSIANGEYIKPEAALNQLSAKLGTIGVTVKDKIEIKDKKGNFESALVFNGGRFGKDTDGSDINDDGISHKSNSLKLKGKYETLKNGAVKVYAELG